MCNGGTGQLKRTASATQLHHTTATHCNTYTPWSPCATGAQDSRGEQLLQHNCNTILRHTATHICLYLRVQRGHRAAEKNNFCKRASAAANRKRQSRTFILGAIGEVFRLYHWLKKNSKKVSSVVIRCSQWNRQPWTFALGESVLNPKKNRQPRTFALGESVLNQKNWIGIWMGEFEWEFEIPQPSKKTTQKVCSRGEHYTHNTFRTYSGHTHNTLRTHMSVLWVCNVCAMSVIWMCCECIVSVLSGVSVLGGVSCGVACECIVTFWHLCYILRSLLIVATPYFYIYKYTYAKQSMCVTV